ncbi:MAG: hypothetical protein KDH09_01445 [Chrysiogenetes bacterium]|nr:hypothetical protein [Chrysiogenetes bacterium]
MNDPAAKRPQGQKARRSYAAPAIVHEETIESVAVVCDPASNPGLPVKRTAGEPNPMSPSGVCENGFLNS